VGRRWRDGAGGNESGLAGLAFVVAAAFALVVFVMLADVVTMQFTRAAVRAATGEAVRAGSRSDTPVTECETRARAVLAGLLGPDTRDRVTVSCAVSGVPEMVRARAEAALTPWIPGLPVWTFVVDRDAVREALP